MLAKDTGSFEHEHPDTDFFLVIYLWSPSLQRFLFPSFLLLYIVIHPSRRFEVKISIIFIIKALLDFADQFLPLLDGFSVFMLTVPLHFLLHALSLLIKAVCDVFHTIFDRVNEVVPLEVLKLYLIFDTLFSKLFFLSKVERPVVDLVLALW